MTTLAELTTPLTKDAIEAAIYAAIEARGVKTTSWKPGAIARTIIAGASIVLAAFSTLQAKIAEGGFLELAVGDWLTIVARHVYNVERGVGTFAAGNVELDNNGGGVFAVAVGDLLVLNTGSGKTYRNTAAFSLAAFEQDKIVPVQAVEIGSESSANIGDIDALETILLGVVVSNPAPLVGQDPETDAALTLRALAKTGTLSANGPADAYRFLALSAVTDSGESAGVTRVTTIPDGEGNVDVYVATASGPVTGTIGDTSTALGAVDESIQTFAVPLAVTATVISATALSVAVTYTAWVRSTVGLTATEIADQVESALAIFMSTQPIGGSRKVPGGGFVFKEGIEAVIGETIGTANLIDLSVTVPAADTAVTVSQAPVLGTVTETINLIAL